MIFTSIDFALFFALFLLVHATLPARHRKYWLLASSYFFYGSWNAKFVVLLFLSTVVDFFVGRAIHDTSDAKRRRRLLGVSLGFNLGILGIFKYFDFFVESAASGIAALGFDVSPPLLNVVLPVGISFYTFQSMSYTIDIYRRELEPTNSFLDFATFVSLFPQLVAGPIERASHLLPQLSRMGGGLQRADLSGIALIALGVFKKAVIADNLAGYVDATYLDPAATYAPALWIGTYAFALQIYCDFSGYCDIAVGIGRLLGLDLMQNFRAPYAAAGPAEFWRRWHISLSTWLRDYLYISLGGNRGTPFQLRRNLLVTMLLGGLWHGAAWNFLLWGAYHGFLLVLFRGDHWKRLLERLEAGSRVRRLVLTASRRFFFFHLVCIGWALFRAGSLEECRIVVWKLIAIPSWDLAAWLDHVAASGEGPVLAAIVAAIGLFVLGQNLWPIGSFEWVARAGRIPAAARYAVIALLFYCALIFSPTEAPPFIYFAF